MEKIIIYSFVISILFYIVKYVENRILYKPPPLGPNDEQDDIQLPSMKPYFRDSILIFICSVSSMFFIEQITPAVMTMMGGISTGEILDASSPHIFTGQPGF